MPETREKDVMAGDYSPAAWRLIIERAPRTGAWNMALDEAIMDTVAKGEVPPTLRFYTWEPACLSLGKRQPLDGVDLARCRADGVDVVRRATGGFAILHTDELTYSIVTRPDDPRADGAILDAYRKLSQGLLAGLRLLGATPEMNPVVPGGVHNASAACFEVPSAYEIVVSHQKLIGSAQARPHGRVLQHGSLPLVGDITRVVRYLAYEREEERAALATHLRERATTASDALGRLVSYHEAAEAMARGFAAALNLTFEPDEPSAAELAAAEQRLVEKIVK
ncbi:MAG TPA: biotin/lipoate A/B protein ligase family protein [Ktedonobacterales bacterium]|nr:biotin/lipoate A/B protein ligase family protein [Ktedonobacterales bacterium]